MINWGEMFALTQVQEYHNVFECYLPKLATILLDLQQFYVELVNIDKSNPPLWFHQTLFNSLRHILSFTSFLGRILACWYTRRFPQMTSTPLKQVLFLTFPTSPDPKAVIAEAVIAEAVQVNLANAIEKYSKTLKSLIPLFTTFSEIYILLSDEQAATVPRILDDSPGTHATTGGQCMSAWNGTKMRELISSICCLVVE